MNVTSRIRCPLCPDYVATGQGKDRTEADKKAQKKFNQHIRSKKHRSKLKR